jgi:hypothetical protein
MKKLFLLVLCFFLVAGSAQAGAGGNSARQDEQLRQAGKSSIYFYEVNVTNNHGSGRLVIDTDKRTFIFNGQDFKPDHHVYLQFKTDGNLVVAASGRSTPSGNLHIAGKWEIEAAPAVVEAVSYLYPVASGFDLTNQGGFMAKLAVLWTTEWDNSWGPVNWKETSATDSFGLNKSRRVNFEELGIPYGAYVKIHAIVVGGSDQSGDDWYYYETGPCYIPGYCYPVYTISRTTWNPILEWWRTDCYCSPPPD